MRFRAFAPLAVAGTIALAACGGGGDTSADTTVPADVTIVADTSDTSDTADTSVPAGTADTSVPADVTVATTAATAVASVVTVIAIEGIAWDEKDYTATAGDVVITAVNESSLPHNLYIVDPSGTRLPDVLDIPSRGDSVDETVTLEAGTYTLICTIPGHNNMNSTLTVN